MLALDSPIHDSIEPPESSGLAVRGVPPHSACGPRSLLLPRGRGPFSARPEAKIAERYAAGETMAEEPGVGHAGRPDCTDYLVGGLATTAEGSIQRHQAFDRRARDVSSLRSTKSSGDQPSSARIALILRIDTSRSEVETRNANDARLPMHFAIAAPLLAAPPDHHGR